MSTEHTAFSRRALSRMIAGGSAAGLLAVAARAGAKTPSEGSGTLEDQFAIEQLLYRYAIALDSLDTERLAQCWAPGAVTREGIEGIITYHRTYEHTMHNVLNHSYELDGRNGTGVAYCVASMVKNNAGQLAKFDVYFRYRDELVKHEGRWLLSKRGADIIFSTKETPVLPGAPLLGIPSFKPASFRKRAAADSAK